MAFYKKQGELIIFDFKLFRIKFNCAKKRELKNNKLIINNKKYNYLHKVNGLELQFLGQNSEVVIDKDIKFENCKFIIKSNVKIHIKKTIHKIKNLIISSYDNINIFIDEDFSCHGVYMELHDEPFKNIKIGKDCMFSWDILIRNSDGHAIYDIESKKLLNEGGDIVIGDHVWVGRSTTILKKATIPSNSIVGIGAIVNKSFETNNIVIAGIPAKIVKRNVNWKRESPAYYKGGAK